MTLTRPGVGPEIDHRESLRYEPFAATRGIFSMIRDAELRGSAMSDLDSYLQSLEIQYYLKGVLEVFQESDALYRPHASSIDVSGPVARMVAILREKFGPGFHDRVSESSVQIAFHQGVSEALSAVIDWSRKVVTV
ncbi:hypothetical protein EGT67_06580 [Prescottella agglutinans]|uniref:Uncharacterized protein n=1 Tax=Prescottella agglutinans TaxID=1644129 RepID=A0A3S3BGN6_9NOCA|nr:hypothetical protein [Prescottella agglutinans]RVW10801.1 hypothetical protein EGT67_06580 [Prescottella agglutinans]